MAGGELGSEVALSGMEEYLLGNKGSFSKRKFKGFIKK
jgi:hypothetical protein